VSLTQVAPSPSPGASLFGLWTPQSNEAMLSPLDFSTFNYGPNSVTTNYVCANGAWQEVAVALPSTTFTTTQCTMTFDISMMSFNVASGVESGTIVEQTGGSSTTQSGSSCPPSPCTPAPIPGGAYQYTFQNGELSLCNSANECYYFTPSS
jgi:hypothetical protein